MPGPVHIKVLTPVPPVTLNPMLPFVDSGHVGEFAKGLTTI